MVGPNFILYTCLANEQTTRGIAIGLLISVIRTVGIFFLSPKYICNVFGSGFVERLPLHSDTELLFVHEWEAAEITLPLAAFVPAVPAHTAAAAL